MVHADVFQPEFNDDTVIGQVMWELNQLIPEILYKLVVDVWYPCLQTDGHILEQKVHTLILLKHRLQLDQLLRL